MEKPNERYTYTLLDAGLSLVSKIHWCQNKINKFEV